MMTPEAIALMAGAVFVVAFLYSSVGHAGASGYIAVMALFGVASAIIKPTALLLNIAVASIGALQFWRAGYFQWRLFWPFALLSIPCAFLGGYANLPSHFFKMLVGLVLLFSAVRLVIKPPEETEPHLPKLPVAIGTGASLGLLAGLTGTGGGIFLTPLMLFRHWALTKNVSAASAMFILANSLAGLAGNFSSAKTLPRVAWPLLAAVMVGGTMGSYLGCRHFSATLIKRLLAVVLFVAGLKLILA